MKLYYKPGACSLASHIALTESGAVFQLEQVDTAAGKTASGQDYLAINPKGYVPALELDDGRVITEGAAILQYIADQHPDAALAPAAGTFERAKLQEHLNYVASELHKSFSPFFTGEKIEDEARSAFAEKVLARMQQVEAILADGRSYLGGNVFSVADAYLFVVSNWANFVDISLDSVPRLKAFVTRVAGRAATQSAMKAEGLIG